MRLAAILALASMLLGCGAGASSAPAAASPCAHTAPISVNFVNDWPGRDPEEYAAEQAASCTNLVHFEMLPWWDRLGACDDAHPGLCTETYRDKRRAFLRSMSAHRITSLWTTQNSNAEGPWRQTDAWFRDRVRELREDASDVGMEYVWAGTPSEPWRADWRRGRDRALIARDEWPGTLVVPDLGANYPTGRPYYSGVAYDWLEVHPCRLADVSASLHFGPPVLTVTDCGGVLVPGEPALSDLTREALTVGRPLLWYDFSGSRADAIELVGGIIGGVLP